MVSTSDSVKRWPRSCFGSITTKEIADALDRRGITVEKHQVMLDEPLKQLGSYKVQVKVAPHLVSEVTVVIEPKVLLRLLSAGFLVVASCT